MDQWGELFHRHPLDGPVGAGRLVPAFDRRRSGVTAVAVELGYQSTEFRGTIALDAETPHGLPPLHHHFFEFVEHAQWDRGNARFCTLDQLEIGRRYYILVTTASGLYRYFMNDLVEVSGFFHRTPLLRFVQKGKGVTSLTGEKLYEGQAIDAVLGATGKNTGSPRVSSWWSPTRRVRRISSSSSRRMTSHWIHRSSWPRSIAGWVI